MTPADRNLEVLRAGVTDSQRAWLLEASNVIRRTTGVIMSSLVLPESHKVNYLEIIRIMVDTRNRVEPIGQMGVLLIAETLLNFAISYLGLIGEYHDAISRTGERRITLEEHRLAIITRVGLLNSKKDEQPQ